MGYDNTMSISGPDDDSTIKISRQPNIPKQDNIILTSLQQIKQQDATYTLETNMPPKHVDCINKLFVQYYPFGRGGINESRYTRVSFSEWAKSEFERGLDAQHFILACNNMNMRTESKNKTFVY